MILPAVGLVVLAMLAFWLTLRFMLRRTDRLMQRHDQDLKGQMEAISGPVLRELETAVAGLEQPLTEASEALARSIRCLENLVADTETKAVIREEVNRIRQEVREDYFAQMQSGCYKMAIRTADKPEAQAAPEPLADWEQASGGVVKQKGPEVVVCR